MTRTKAERAARRTWNRCDVCKQFISMLSLENGTAIRRIITPDSAYTSEDYETLCPKHNLLQRTGLLRQWDLKRQVLRKLTP